MKKFIRAWLAIVGCAVLALIGMANTEHQAQASNPTNPSPVFVTNTPLPVQGAVSVANTPSVNIANSSVAVSGTVSVANAVDAGNQPIPLTVSPQGTPYADSCNVAVGDSCTMKPIASGRRLVIRAITFSSYFYDGFYRSAELDTTVGGNQFSAFLALLQVGSQPYGGGSYTYQATNHATVVFADSGTSPTCSGVPTILYDRGFTCTISGYLVPAQ